MPVLPCLGFGCVMRIDGADCRWNPEAASERTLQKFSANGTTCMDSNNEGLEPAGPKRSMSAVGVILTIVCVLSGIYSSTHIAEFFPIWLALIITVAVGLLLVGSLAVSLGNELLDVVIGCIVVIFVMVVVVPVGAKEFRQHFPATGRVNQTMVEGQ